MPWVNWLPWRLVIRHLARAHGFLDPMALTGRLRRFAQPSEVAEPVELLRAGAIFHARGLINSRVIQHNLDWVWPHWIERQFNPLDDAFVPRAFSLTHVNLTHRNWTAIGLPDYDHLPIVDPRGLLTPLYDGWSLDAWLLTDDGQHLLPSRADSSSQQLEYAGGLAVTTETTRDDLFLRTRAAVDAASTGLLCCQKIEAKAATPGWLVLALRPCNPEGVSFVHQASLGPTRRSWTIDGDTIIGFSDPVEKHQASDYHRGDVYIHLHDSQDEQHARCDVGLVTAAAMFRIEANVPRSVSVEVPLNKNPATQNVSPAPWSNALAGHCRLSVPEPRIKFLYDAAIRTLILHSPKDVYPGPYTYKRFWFRDAAFIIHALLCVGLISRAERALKQFQHRQGPLGYFHSQAGEWDANGEALWILQRFCQLTGQSAPPHWHQMIERGARWIARKRLPDNLGSPVAGLLPAGFSAEHLGPNDYYYWDDFWSIAGLQSASQMCARMGEKNLRDDFAQEALAMSHSVDKSLTHAAVRLQRKAMPAAPYRRMDAGAIGSISAGYPLQLSEPRDPRLLDTVEYLLHNCFVANGFFQDMTHSGINPYLTLHVAQILLRADDERYLSLMDRVAELASPTGQWPEAIHPRTDGGCMGDGQHVWAAAEWVLMLRHCFVREESERLILCQGIPQRWLENEQELYFGPAPTSFGTVTVTLKANATADRVTVNWQDATWHEAPPTIEIRLPGFTPVIAVQGDTHASLVRDGS
ncbi:hypothetical protein R0135_15225 [Congregibacter variabilis]|uniref:Glucoamylase (Glucan-1,4-alpha-glucosidase), GH15 family n=1 Tax=Congregibacter variabilis TaxID=3081200 RepID=A0ABZ0I3L6_9GAMM|nr:hypothetical protein R0135_15225 [Congregibacter sp. IMCC43200]